METEGSGAAGCYDDEDCYQDEYNYYYEGSGSGEDTDEKPQQPAKVSFYSDYISANLLNVTPLYSILLNFTQFFINFLIHFSGITTKRRIRCR